MTPDPIALDPALRLVLRAALACCLAASAVGKLRDATAFRAFAAAVEDYRLLPRRAVWPAAGLLAGAEALLAAALLAAPGALPALGAAALLLLYAAAISVNLARGRRHIACGCGGPAGAQGISAGLVLRNLALALAACLAALPAAGRALAWPDAVTVIAGGATLVLLELGAELALRNGARLRALRRPA